ncbi:MAG: nitroreductase family protein [Salinivirgaceae bacterium]|nr:nitroreductase family protein [Salinivirgaceae bacterium]
MKPTNLKYLVQKNRSYRRFDQNFEISEETIVELIDLARLSASARNQQSLKYFISNSESVNKKIFPCLSWAGYLKDWDGPIEGQKPSAYIIMLNDTKIATNYFCDHGIAAQSILLGATEIELGGCIIASVNKSILSSLLGIPKHLEILQVLALGKPIEHVRIEEMQDDDYKYWRDQMEIHHVPKRSLEEIILK